MTVNENAYQQTAYNPLETEGQKRQFALDNKIPPELHAALGAIDGHSGFGNMTRADQIAALQAVERMTEMHNLLLEQGETPSNTLASLTHHARTEMGHTGLSMAQIALLTKGYNGGLREGAQGQDALILDPYESEQRKAALMNSYADGLANRQFSEGTPATIEEIEDFARAHGLNRDALLDKLAENNVEVKNTITPNAAEPAIGLINTGFNAALMTNALGMSTKMG